MRWLFLLLSASLSSPAEGDSPLPPPAFHSVCSPDGATCADLDPESWTTRAYPADRPEQTLWVIGEWFLDATLADDGRRFYAHASLLVPQDAGDDWPILRIFDAGELKRIVTLSEVVERRGLERHGTVSHFQWGLPLGLGAEGCFRLWTAAREERCYGVK